MKMKTLFFALVCALVLNFTIVVDNAEAENVYRITIKNNTNDKFRWFVSSDRTGYRIGIGTDYLRPGKSITIRRRYRDTDSGYLYLALYNERIGKSLYNKGKHAFTRDYGNYKKLHFFKQRANNSTITIR